MAARRSTESRSKPSQSKSKNEESTNNQEYSGASEFDGPPHHHHASRLIDKFMQKKMEKLPPETHENVRQQSVFNFVDRKKIDRRRSKPTGFKRFVKKIKKYRTISATFLLLIYIAAGAAMFWAIEKKSKEQNIKEYKEKIMEKSRDLYDKIRPNPLFCKFPLTNKDNLENNKCLKEIYDEMYSLSPPTQMIGDYWDGLIYVITLITTIGYGNLLCFTLTGRLVTVVYGIIGIALSIYVLRNNGKLALKCCNRILTWISCCFCGICGAPGELVMTVTKSIILLFVFWIFGALAIASFEEFTFGNAIYFAFSTFSTVGFGDFVPVNHLSAGVIFALHFIDLSLLSMVFALIHESMENNFMVVLELLDEGYRKHTTCMVTTTNMNLVSPAGSKHNLKMATAREKSDDQK